jgi:hypothetical protein
MEVKLDKPTYLPLTGDDIRLLTLKPGPFQSPIHCHLERASLGAKCVYEALSYVWGKDEGHLTITLNMAEHPVRKNLECALRHLRDKEHPRIFWIDAICINQADTDERSKQVAMMGNIYKKASKVYAWLGEADDQLNCVFDVLREFHMRKREAIIPTHFDASEQLEFHRQLFAETFEKIAGYLPKQSPSDNDILHEEFNWIGPLYERCYWRRVWIVQELVLAKSIVVCCGDKSIDFDDIYGLSLDWGSFEQGFDAETFQKLQGHQRGWSTIQAIRGHRRRREPVLGIVEEPFQMETTLPGTGDDAMLDEVIMIYAKYHECSCPKDKIYGFRELVSQWKEKLLVDYKKSKLEVFLDVARLGLFDPKQYGGRHVAACLWEAMNLDETEDFSDYVRQHLPEVDLKNE